MQNFWKKLVAIGLVGTGTILINDLKVNAAEVIPLPDALDFIEDSLDFSEKILGENVSKGIENLITSPQVQDIIQTTSDAIELYEKGRDIYQQAKNLPQTVYYDLLGRIPCQNSKKNLRSLKRCLKELQRDPQVKTKVLSTLGPREITTPTVGGLSENELAVYEDFLNLYDLQTARLIASKYLAEQGEERAASKFEVRQDFMEDNVEILKKIREKVKKASKEDVTQKVLKIGLEVEYEQAKMNLMQTKKINDLDGEIERLQEIHAAGLAIKANLAEELSELNKYNRLARESAYKESRSFNFYLPGLWQN